MFLGREAQELLGDDTSKRKVSYLQQILSCKKYGRGNSFFDYRKGSHYRSANGKFNKSDH